MGISHGITMTKKIKVVHYLNQFFGGIGGEEKANAAPQIRTGAVGPGRAINKILGDRGEVVGTIICGDNYFAENTDQALEKIASMISAYNPDLLLAGPAFNAGRYGVACGEICEVTQDRLGIVALTAMFEENPGTALFQQEVYIVKTQESVRGMIEAVTKMVSIGLRLVNNELIGPALNEGYYPRGIVKNEFTEKNGAARAVDMVLAKIKGEPFQPELALPKPDRVEPAILQKELASAKVALATDGGLVPKGNPDNMESNRSTRFAAYDIEGRERLSPDDFEVNHMGFDTSLVNQDPNRLVPLDVLREFENEGVIGQIHNEIYTTAGVATSLENAGKIARGMVAAMKDNGVDAVILTST